MESMNSLPLMEFCPEASIYAAAFCLNYIRRASELHPKTKGKKDQKTNHKFGLNKRDFALHKLAQSDTVAALHLTRSSDADELPRLGCCCCHAASMLPLPVIQISLALLVELLLQP